MLTKEAILAELKKRKRNYYKRMKEILQTKKVDNKKWNEFKRKFQACSFITYELTSSIKHPQHILFTYNVNNRKVCCFNRLA